MKKLKYVIIALILLAGLVVYSFIDKMNAIYDTKFDNSEYQMIQIDKDDLISQSFVCKEKTIDGVAVKVALSEVKKEEKIKVVIKNEKTQTILVTAEKNADEFKNGKFNKVLFEKLENCEDESFIVEISVVDKDENSVITLYKTPESTKNTILRYGNDITEGTAVLKIVTHRFDVETFIVCGFLVAFIIVFMRVLYKLFK